MAIAPIAEAQSLVTSVSGGASFVRGLGSRERAIHFGGGVETGSGPLRFGGEAGLVHFPAVTQTFFDAGGRPRGGSSMPAASLGAIAVRGSYYPGRFDESRLRPFVSAGLSVYLETEPFGSLDVGGGIDFWATRHAGLRIEAREQLATMFTVRVGLVFVLD
jgi:hypothetical protein